MYTALDCQGFAGGFTLGMVRAGFTLIGKREHRGGFGVRNCEVNRHLLGHAWVAEARDAADWTPLPTHVVFGNPPCSGFSVATPKEARGIHAKVNSCMWDLVRFAARCEPVIVAFESVRSAYSLGYDLMLALRAELERLSGREYTLYHVLHDAYELGSCQVRRRYFWVASRVRLGFEWPNITGSPTLRDAITDLEPLDVQWEAQPYRAAPTWWAEPALSSSGQVDGHQAARVNPHQLRLDELFKYAYEVGGWQQGEIMPDLLRRLYTERGEVPPLFESRLNRFLERDFKGGFVNPMRVRYDTSARVVDGATLHRVIHPVLDRTLTHREAARLMGFLDDWRIEPLRHEHQPMLEMTWGKGITVQCGEWLGRQLRASLDGNPGPDRGTPIGDREYFVKRGHRPPIGLYQREQPSSIEGASVPRLGRREKPTTPVFTDNTEGDSTVTEPQYPLEDTAETAETTDVQKQATAGTDEGEEGTDETVKTDGRRGRPRPQITLTRDAAVLRHMAERGGQLTVKEIAAGLGGEFAENVVYACLNRLSWGDGNKQNPIDPRVEKVDRSKYQVTAVGYEKAGVTPPEPTSEPEPAAEGEPAVEAQREMAGVGDTSATWE